ncbi:MAG TPA: hypothetical protein VJL58_07670 [Pyrinomonadaceae bacterium]|nr:hypothetical protein [Pyrinomonadaceae bacterium]
MESAFKETKSAEASELDEPRWSVVSFEGLAAAGLTYSQAVHMMAELDAERIAGLCVITDEAARKLKPQHHLSETLI